MMTFLARMKIKEGKEADFIRLAKALTMIPRVPTLVMHGALTRRARR